MAENQEVPVQPDIIQMMTQFGVAGLMGMLWIWERFMSRKREAQLTCAHERLMGQQEQVRVLIRIVHRNTQAMERFEQTQNQLRLLLEKMNDAIQRKAA